MLTMTYEFICDLCGEPIARDVWRIRANELIPAPVNPPLLRFSHACPQCIVDFHERNDLKTCEEHAVEGAEEYSLKPIAAKCFLCDCAATHWYPNKETVLRQLIRGVARPLVPTKAEVQK